jgi:hypothetical protein
MTKFIKHAITQALTQPVLVVKSKFTVNEVMNPHFFWLSLGLPLFAAILEVADQLFLLGVYRNDRIACRLILRNGAGDVAELGIAVLMLPTLSGLDRGFAG